MSARELLLAVIAGGAVGGSMPAASAPEPDPAHVEWVVDSVLYARSSDTHSVACIPVEDLALPETERERIEGPVKKWTADHVWTGDPCPDEVPR